MERGSSRKSNALDDDRRVSLNATQSTPTSGKHDESRARCSQTMSRLPSNDSLNYSTGPGSPGVHHDYGDTSNLSRKESYKAQRKRYRKEKKRVVNEVATSLRDPSVVFLANWLKVRGTLKSWTKLFCVLKPGLLLLYKSAKIKSNHWVGTILLNCCQVIERPSKKHGFCFKLFHPLDQSIWAPRGPEKESIGAVVQPLPTSYLIFRASSQADGKCWMDALELALRSSNILVRSMSNKSTCNSANHETQWSEADCEKHFCNDAEDLDDTNQTDDGNQAENLSNVSESESDASIKETIVNEPYPSDEDITEITEETEYIPNNEELLNTESGVQSQDLPEEQRSFIWSLLKQVRPGMDLSKVVLPTFILEPRSFLDKLADAYYHVDILSRAVLDDDPFNRMKRVVTWYLSGFYKKPKGLKKPYNPILGETFRCYWKHANSSRTFYIAEQVSHHPPVSAFYVTNRQDGFSISCSIMAKSKFYVNSTAAILDGIAILTLLPRGEEYTMNLPDAHCKGILMGTLLMEYGGKVQINCEKTNYSAEIEFKVKSFLRSSSDVNQISGCIKMGNENLATISGHWDGQIKFKDRRSGLEEILWDPTPDVRKSRLTRYVVPVEKQDPFESERLWMNVSAAIQREDQIAATEEKTILEEAQRNDAKERQMCGIEWEPKLFKRDEFNGGWVYKAADLRPWDPRNDVYQYELRYKILTKTRHPTPMIRTASIVSVDSHTPNATVKALPRRKKLAKQSESLSSEIRESMSTSADDDARSDTSVHAKRTNMHGEWRKMRDALAQLDVCVHQQKELAKVMQQIVDKHAATQRELFASVTSARNTRSFNSNLDVILIVFATILLQYIIEWVCARGVRSA